LGTRRFADQLGMVTEKLLSMILLLLFYVHCLLGLLTSHLPLWFLQVFIIFSFTKLELLTALETVYEKINPV